jgi:DNA-binding response OmpR family regulator
MKTTNEDACPCCGQRLPVNQDVEVYLEKNTVVHAGLTAKLTSKQAEVAYILARRMPAPVPNDMMLDQLYGGATDAPVSAENCLRVFTCKLRKAVRPIGLDVLNVYGRGYSLAVVN